MKKPAVVLVLLGMSSLLLADHPGSVDTQLEGGLVYSKSFKTNFLIYKRIGGRTEAKGIEEKPWWCAWLCKRRADRTAERIAISNTYFSEVQPGVFASLEREPKTCMNASSCEQKEWAIGLGIKLEFPGGSASPTTLGGLLPVDGVITRHDVLIDGRSVSAITSVGKHPAPSGPVFE